MEIIKKGNPDRAWWRVNQPVRFECDLCGCQWEAVRGEYQVVSDYQHMREDEFVKTLRQRYPVEIDYEALKTVNKH